MKINERVKKMSKKKQVALVTLFAVIFISICYGIGRLLINIFEKLANKIEFIIITPTVTGAIMLAITGGLIYFILLFIFSKNKIDGIKEILNSMYGNLKSFGFSVGGTMTDFLLILFACMNFNKIVSIAGVHPGITMSALSIGIFALSVRGIFRALQIGNMDFYIRKFLNTDKDVVYEN